MPPIRIPSYDLRLGHTLDDALPEFAGVDLDGEHYLIEIGDALMGKAGLSTRPPTYRLTGYDAEHQSATAEPVRDASLAARIHEAYHNKHEREWAHGFTLEQRFWLDFNQELP